MPDETSATDGQAPVASASGQEPVATPQAGGESQQSQMSLEDALAALKKAREEAASHRVKARELDELKHKLENEKLSETERLQKQLADHQKQLADLTTQAQERIVRAEIKAAARDFGIKPELAARLIDYADIQYDETTGDPTNIDKLLAGIAKAYPELTGAAQPARPAANSGGPSNPGRSATSTSSRLTWEDIGKMTPDEYRARRAEIQAFMDQTPRPRK